MTDDRASQLFAFRDFTVDELQRRRQKLADKLAGRGKALVPGTVALEGSPLPRQSNDFYYLAGLDPATAYLLVDCERGGETTIYLGPRDARREDVDGPELSHEDDSFIHDVAGIEHVRPLAELPDDLKNEQLLHVPRRGAEGLRTYVDVHTARRRTVAADPLMSGYVWPEPHLHAVLSALAPACSLNDLSVPLHDVRLTKSPAELDLMRVAGKLSGAAVVEAMRSTRQGVSESDLAAVAEYVFRRGHSFGGSHNPIIASGWTNIYAMHYWRLTGKLNAGDFVLMDYAPDYRYYTSDIGRMWPVDGKYDRVQRSMYGLAVAYHVILLEEIRAGRTIDDVYAAARPRFKSIVDDWDFPDDEAKQAGHDLVDSPRPLSHPVGMAIHDPGNQRTANRELQVGDVFSVDPELFDRKQRRYVRSEDTVAVTKDGCEVLTNCPLTIDDIEAGMAKAPDGGMLQQFPKVDVS